MLLLAKKKNKMNLKKIKVENTQDKKKSQIFSEIPDGCVGAGRGEGVEHLHQTRLTAPRVVRQLPKYKHIIDIKNYLYY